MFKSVLLSNPLCVLLYFLSNVHVIIRRPTELEYLIQPTHKHISNADRGQWCRNDYQTGTSIENSSIGIDAEDQSLKILISSV